MRITVQRDSRNRKDGTAMVRLALNKGKTLRHPLGIWVKASEWDDRYRKLKVNARSNWAVLNKRIEQAKADAEAYVAQKPDATVEEVLAALKDGGHKGESLLAFTLRDLEKNPPKSWHTAQQRRLAVQRFDKFSPGIRPEDMAGGLMGRYRAHMIARKVKPNTAATQLRMLRTLYVRACKGRMALKDILVDVDAVERYEEVPEMLSPEEVQRLEVYAEGRTGWKAGAVHRWLFSLYSGGIRWTDICLLEPKNIRDDRVRFIAHKTGKPKNVPLHPKAKAIAAIYSDGKRLFPLSGEPIPERVRSANTLANKYLKVAARACGIEKRLHTHNARHSFTDWAIRAGMDDRAIQSILGVDDKAYKHYRSRFPQEHLDQQMQGMWSRVGA